MLDTTQVLDSNIPGCGKTTAAGTWSTQPITRQPSTAGQFWSENNKNQCMMSVKKKSQSYRVTKIMNKPQTYSGYIHKYPE